MGNSMIDPQFGRVNENFFRILPDRNTFLLISSQWTEFTLKFFVLPALLITVKFSTFFFINLLFNFHT